MWESMIVSVGCCDRLRASRPEHSIHRRDSMGFHTKYSNPAVAQRSLEQLTSAVLAVQCLTTPEPLRLRRDGDIVQKINRFVQAATVRDPLDSPHVQFPRR